MQKTDEVDRIEASRIVFDNKKKKKSVFFLSQLLFFHVLFPVDKYFSLFSQYVFQYYF